jgi:hypothetical protein
MKNIYLDTPNAAIALNFKVGSSTLARAVIAAHHHELNGKLSNGTSVHYPAGKSANNTRWQGICPKVDAAERPVVLLAVRNPVEKFRSACAECNITDVDAKLTALEKGRERDIHFLQQSRLLQKTTKLYIFPDHLDDLATEAGLELPLPDIDGGHNRDKPNLTTEQLSRVQKIYSMDIALFESITSPGIVHGTTKISIPVPEFVANWRARAILEIDELLQTVENLLLEIPGDTGIVARAAWNAGANLTRQGSTVTAIASTLQLSTEQIDSLFIRAAALEV